MRTRLVRVGNSRGVRLPQEILAQSGLTDEVDIIVEPGALILRPAADPRAGWAAAFEAMAAAGDDALLDGDALPTAFDVDEWTWT